MITAGMDFAWQFAEVNFKFFENVTALYASHETGRKFKFMFSTVDEYFQAIFLKQQEEKFNWPTYTSDFFPYNGYHIAHYWTGYFTSRPNFKKYLRDFTGLVQASDTYFGFEMLYTMNTQNGLLSDQFNKTHSSVVKTMNQLVGTNIHHDTITGTSPNYVIQNETLTVQKSEIADSEVLISSLTNKLINEEGI